MIREKLIYRETYKKGAYEVRKDCLPVTKHTNLYQPRRMVIQAAGVVEIAGEQFEFQDVRLYFPHESSSSQNGPKHE